MKELRVKAKEEHRIKKGHYWLFSNELEKIDKTIKPGEIVRLLDCRDNILGYGFFNPHSLISVRFITKSEEPPAKNFIFETIDTALEYRKTLGLRKYGRMCYGEADGAPGLIIDRYGDYLVIEILTAGMENLKEDILAAVKKFLSQKVLFLKMKAHLERLKGFPKQMKLSAKYPKNFKLKKTALNILSI